MYGLSFLRISILAFRNRNNGLTVVSASRPGFRTEMIVLHYCAHTIEYNKQLAYFGARIYA